jgi:hypothetical protein
MILRWALSVAAWLALIVPTYAQREVPDVPPSAFYEGRIDRAMQTGTQGVVIIDVVIPNARFSSMHIRVGRMLDGKLQQRSVFGSDWFFGKQTRWGAITALPAGDYMVLGAVGSNGNHKSAFNGPYAKFSVHAGEIVDVGVLQLDHTTKMDEGVFAHTGTGTLHKSVGKMSPDARKYVSEQIPNYLRRVVSRPMTVIGSTDVSLRVHTGR